MLKLNRKHYSAYYINTTDKNCMECSRLRCNYYDCYRFPDISLLMVFVQCKEKGILD